MLKTTRVTFLLGLLMICAGAFSQSNATLGRKFFNNWSITAGGGLNLFYGDLKQFRFFPALTPINEIRFAGSFSLNRQLSHVFMLRGQVVYGQIAGEKTNYKDGSICNQYFEGSMLEYNLNTTINFSNLFGGYKPSRFFFVYGTLGAGFSNWLTESRDITTGKLIASSGTAGNWTTEVVVPAGLGAYFSIKNKVNLGLEYTVRGLYSDFLDATPGGFPYDATTLLALNVTYNFDRPKDEKLNPAVYQRQIGPPPPKAALTELIEEEKKRDEAAKAAQKNKPPASEILPVPVLPPADTLKSGTELSPDTLQSIEAETEAQDLAGAGSAAALKGISYRVQVFAYKEDTYSPEQIQARFKLSQAVMKEHSGGWYRYTVGSFKDVNEAKKLLTRIRTSKNVPDAFIAKYINGKRATPSPPHTTRQKHYYKGKVYFSKPKKKK